MPFRMEAANAPRAAPTTAWMPRYTQKFNSGGALNAATTTQMSAPHTAQILRLEGFGRVDISWFSQRFPLQAGRRTLQVRTRRISTVGAGHEPATPVVAAMLHYTIPRACWPRSRPDCDRELTFQPSVGIVNYLLAKGGGDGSC